MKENGQIDKMVIQISFIILSTHPNLHSFSKPIMQSPNGSEPINQNKVKKNKEPKIKIWKEKKFEPQRREETTNVKQTQKKKKILNFWVEMKMKR
jgi:hypothetical protein